jgi:isopenicillin-N N-acyltransferase-like protein
VRNTVAVYRRLLRETTGAGDAELRRAGETVAGVVGARWPDLVAELEGIAAGAGVDAETLLAVNARTELLGGAASGECSLLARAVGSECLVAQNWDWHPDLAASLLVWRVRQPGGRWFATLTEAGMLAKLGLSSTGCCVGLNFLRSSWDGGVSGVPVHVLLRLILDRCDGLLDALRLLISSRTSASSCITVGHARADAAVVAAEVSPAGCAYLWPGADGRLLHTNHFLAPRPDGLVDREAEEAPGTLLRLWHLEQAAGTAPEVALRSHAGAPESVCRHEVAEDAWADRRATLASVVLEPGVPRLRISDGPPCRAPLEDVAL